MARPVNAGGRDALGGPTAHGFAVWLSLAATPTFAVMAGATAIVGEGPMGVICAGGGMSGLSTMAPMYLLMSAFHASPWLNLIRVRVISLKLPRQRDDSAAARQSNR